MSEAAVITDEMLDKLILDVVKPSWSKLSNVAVSVMIQGRMWDDQRLTARFLALAEAKRLELKGNTDNWQASEVKLAGT